MDNLLWYHLGKQHGGGGGSSGGSSTATEDILGEVQFSDFAESADFPGLGIVSMKAFGSDLESFGIVEGENYTVVWNGVEYKVTAQDSSGVIPGSLLLGNGERVMLSGKSEPFAIGWTPAMVIFFSFDGKTTNKVRIYKTVLENAEAPSVALDFTNGNQTIRPSEDGKALSEVVIMKPDTLIPENVAAGVDIAGTIGTLVAGGGGGGGVQYKAFSYNPTSVSYGMRIPLDIGFKPDLIFLHAQSSHSTTNKMFAAFGASSRMSEKGFAGRPGSANTNVYFRYDGSKVSITEKGGDIDSTTSTSLPIYAADETGFNIAMNIVANVYYYILVWGGLA